VKEDLQKILTATNEWLRFAEAKNVALLAFAAAVLAGLLKAVDFSSLHTIVLALTVGGVLLVALGGLIAMASFRPIIVKPPTDSLRVPRGDDNPLYFGHAAQYSVGEYLQLFAGSRAETPSAIERAYADQIIVNSRIALRKFSTFNWGLGSAIVGVIALLIAGAWNLSVQIGLIH
jgi:hypothetical protein